jgi:hypothetical protein
MAVLTSTQAGDSFWARDPLQERSRSKKINYIGREGLLKSSLYLLTLVFQEVRLCKKRE